LLRGEEILQHLKKWEAEGGTVGWLTLEAEESKFEIVSVFNMADTPRKESKSVVSQLEDRGIRTIMLTGDNHGAAKSVAAKVGLKPENVRAGLLPEDKIAIVIELRDQHEGQDKVGMVGDGVNDAPALAAADIGIAMGMSTGGGGSSASAVAMETADVVLMDSNLEKLVLSVDIGRSTLRKIRENFIVAIGSKVVMIILTVMGLATLWGAIIADVGAMLVVTFNGMTIINKYKLKPSGCQREISGETIRVCGNTDRYQVLDEEYKTYGGGLKEKLCLPQAETTFVFIGIYSITLMIGIAFMTWGSQTENNP